MNKYVELQLYKVKYRAKAPAFRARQLCVNNLFDKESIKVHPNCKTLIRDLEAVEQDPKDFSKNKKNPKLTHASDTMDYMLTIEFPLSGKKPNMVSERIR